MEGIKEGGRKKIRKDGRVGRNKGGRRRGRRRRKGRGREERERALLLTIDTTWTQENVPLEQELDDLKIFKLQCSLAHFSLWSHPLKHQPTLKINPFVGYGETVQ